MAEKAKERKTPKKKTPEGKPAASAKRAPRKKAQAAAPSVSAAEERTRLVREAAYRRAEQRGFQGGNPEEDWYEAEKEVEEMLRKIGRTPPLIGTPGTGGG